MSGYGACFQVTLDGRLLNGGLLNGGLAVSNYHCERLAPSHFEWSVDFGGYGVCLKLSPNKYLLDYGRAQEEFACEQIAP